MNTQVLLFLGKAALLTIAFVLMYRLLLRRETFHGLKRGALMLSLVISARARLPRPQYPLSPLLLL